MRNDRLDEVQARIKTSGRNIKNLRYAGDTTLMAENEEEPKSLLMKVKEKSDNSGLKLNIQKNRIVASGPIISCAFGYLRALYVEEELLDESERGEWKS